MPTFVKSEIVQAFRQDKPQSMKRRSGSGPILTRGDRPKSVSALVASSMHRIGVILLGLLLSGTVNATEPAPIAVLGFELIDTSLQGELQGTSQAELDRLDLITAIVRERLGESGGYRIVDTTPAADEIARVGYLHNCNGCELDIAAELGAEAVLIGWVQKVSNLILNINAVVREVATGRVLAGGSVDIRGNTDESWSRGVEHLLEHQILAE